MLNEVEQEMAAANTWVAELLRLQADMMVKVAEVGSSN